LYQMGTGGSFLTGSV